MYSRLRLRLKFPWIHPYVCKIREITQLRYVHICMWTIPWHCCNATWRIFFLVLHTVLGEISIHVFGIISTHNYNSPRYMTPTIYNSLRRSSLLQSSLFHGDRGSTVPLNPLSSNNQYIRCTVLTAMFKVLCDFHEWQVHRYSLVDNAPSQVVWICCLLGSADISDSVMFKLRTVRKLTHKTRVTEFSNGTAIDCRKDQRT